MSTTTLLQHNIASLRQALEILDLVAHHGLEYGATVGPHLRHVTDHYACFFDGLSRGLIDYDKRERDPTAETQLDVARQRIVALSARLADLSQQSLPPRLMVQLASAADAGAQQSWSSPDRELQFLQSHAVHHYALIRLHLQDLGIDLGAAFGKAPSTLQYEAASA